MDRTLIASGACPGLHTACGSWPRGPEPRFQTRAVPRCPLEGSTARATPATNARPRRKATGSPRRRRPPPYPYSWQTHQQTRVPAAATRPSSATLSQMLLRLTCAHPAPSAATRWRPPGRARPAPHFRRGCTAASSADGNGAPSSPVYGSRSESPVSPVIVPYSWIHLCNCVRTTTAASI